MSGLHGPFHRVETRLQTAADAAMIEKSGELWGSARRGSDIPQVQAYDGFLPVGRRGIEFFTSVAPDDGCVKGQPVWTLGRPDVAYRQKDGRDFAAIPVKVIRNAQSAKV